MRSFNQLCLAMLALGLAVGCAGVGANPSVSAGSSSQQPPFSEKAATPQIIPAGAAIYVRLQQPLSSSTAQTGQSFSAVLDEALMVICPSAAPGADSF